MSLRRPTHRVRVTVPAELRALLDAAAARTGERVADVAVALLAEGLVLYQRRLRPRPLSGRQPPPPRA